MIAWHDKPFDALTARELYAILALRAAVFVVEQNCVYLDLDGKDPACRHLWAARDGEVLAALRIVPPGVSYPEISLGRVVTAPAARGGGLGRELMRRGIAACGDQPIRIGAQCYLERFYRELGFARAGDDYVEDGIPHLEMLRSI